MGYIWDIWDMDGHGSKIVSPQILLVLRPTWRILWHQTLRDLWALKRDEYCWLENWGAIENPWKNICTICFFNQARWDLWVAPCGFKSDVWNRHTFALRNNIQGPFSLQEMCLGYTGCGDGKEDPTLKWWSDFISWKKLVSNHQTWEFERFLLGIWWVSIFHPFPLGGFYPSGLASRNLYSSPKRCLLKLETWNDSRGPPRRLQWHRMGFFQQDLRMRPCAWHSHGSFLTPNLKKGAV
jgi:hypothetical protein